MPSERSRGWWRSFVARRPRQGAGPRHRRSESGRDRRTLRPCSLRKAYPEVGPWHSGGTDGEFGETLQIGGRSGCERDRDDGGAVAGRELVPEVALSDRLRRPAVDDLAHVRPEALGRIGPRVGEGAVEHYGLGRRGQVGEGAVE